MKVLVTGGAGFIGSNFIKYILREHPSYKIINLDKLTYAGNLKNLSDIKNNKNYKFIKGDICDKKLADRVIKECDVVVNFAAESHVDRSIVNPDEFLKTNVFGTYTLLETVKKYRNKRFLQISTDEVYGSIKKDFFKETDMLTPSSPYSASKASADLLAMSYYTTYKLPVLITRSSNNFGPNQYPEKIIPLFITNILREKKVPVYGDGLNIRDWIYVEDNCRAIDLVLHKGKEGEIYNIGANNEKSNLDLTKIILKEMGKSSDYIEYVKDRPGHDRRYAVDCSKIRLLGFKLEYEFDSALRKTINWYKNNKSWWLPLIKK